VANKLEKAGLNAQAAVLVGNPAEEIVRFATEQKADLIVMASRGKSGFSRWDMGNVADKVMRATDIPVFMVKPKPGFKETKPKRRGKAT
jgi:nucleotide-binding universal stress UspA family protein